tara:strand:- start:58 stop:234 length:177 start_codon:yes stop_codon:yes gene_type:complete
MSIETLKLDLAYTETKITALDSRSNLLKRLIAEKEAAEIADQILKPTKVDKIQLPLQA